MLANYELKSKNKELVEQNIRALGKIGDKSAIHSHLTLKDNRWMPDIGFWPLAFIMVGFALMRF